MREAGSKLDDGRGSAAAKAKAIKEGIVESADDASDCVAGVAVTGAVLPQHQACAGTDSLPFRKASVNF